MEQLNIINSKYNFQIESIGNYYKIKSKHDTWFIKIHNNYNNRINLYHSNKMGKNNMHKQLTCQNIVHMFNYIRSHDNKYLKGGVA